MNACPSFIRYGGKEISCQYPPGHEGWHRGPYYGETERFVAAWTTKNQAQAQA